MITVTKRRNPVLPAIASHNWVRDRVNAVKALLKISVFRTGSYQVKDWLKLASRLNPDVTGIYAIV